MARPILTYSRFQSAAGVRILKTAVSHDLRIKSLATIFEGGTLVNKRLVRKTEPYLWILPSIVLMAIFIIVPIFHVFKMAFSEVSKTGKIRGFAGFDNFETVINSSAISIVLKITIVWTIVVVVLSTVLGFIVALLLNNKFNGRKIARAIVVFPWATTLVIQASAWKFIIDTDYGALNTLLKNLGIISTNINWTPTPEAFFAWEIACGIFVTIPFVCFTALSGLQSIDDSLYEASTLDGANYYFGEDGIRFTGWQDTEEGRKLYLSDGTQAFGWAELEGKRYYFDDSGIMVTGWLQLGEYSYYLQEDGSAAVGPTKIGYYTHYFTPVGIHVVLVNAANPLPPYYDMELVTVTGWHQVSSVCLEPLVNMLADCNAAGISYNFNSAHRTVKEQTMILDLRTEEYMDTGMTYEAARAKALQTVAYPGTSEHHLGLAVDLLGDAAIEWLTEHCWEYGFIVRYTQDKYPITGIIDEPWHFRYVGTEVSLAMKDSGLCLEEYLGAA